MKKLHIIYIPGLGDENIGSQRLVLSMWRFLNVDVEIMQMHWSGTMQWDEQLHRLLKRIDELKAQGIPVGLVGVSAGAVAVIQAYALRTDSLVGCVLIAGKVNRPEAIGEQYRRTSPMFVTAAEQSPTALALVKRSARMRILSRYALIDGVVSKADSFVEGAQNQVLFSFGHAYTIATQIIFGAPSIVHFLKRLRK